MSDSRPPRRPRVWLRRVALVAALALVGWLLASYAVAYRLTRRARPPYEEPAPAGVESFRLATADGESLGAWFIEGRPERPVVIVLHGNGHCRTRLLPEGRLASAAGCAALLVTVRAHGDSTGSYNDIGLGASADVVAAVEWVERHRPGRRVIVWGQSLGSAAALYAAGRLGDRVAGYVLECPYRDLATLVGHRTEIYLPFGIRTVAATGLLAVGPLVLSDARASPLKAASEMPSSARVLILAGDADRRARPEEAQAIHERIPNSRLIVIEGGDHLELATADPAGYRAAVVGFLSE